MKKNVFVYGTLIFPEIVFSLTNKKFLMKDAILKGYKRFKVNDPHREQKGPALIEEKGGEVRGKILFDVDKDTIKILDKFEGESYEKKKVFVSVNGKKVEAIVYLGTNFNKDFLHGEWSEEEFKQKHLDFYLKKRIPEILKKLIK